MKEMRAFGTDRLRVSGDRFILLSALPKGWKARTPKSRTHAEFPGTAVLWDDEYFEVVEASAQGNAVRYVLMPWREEHTIRTFEAYDEASEARLAEDYRRAEKQRRASALSSVSGMFLGFLPEPVQKHLQNEYGVTPSRMTILSCIPPLVLMGLIIYLIVGAKIRGVPSPVPFVVVLLCAALCFESVIRFFVAMSQSRGMGSFLGLIVYSIYWRLSPNRATLPSPLAPPPGESTTFMIPPTEDVVLRDKLEMKGPLLTLLTPLEQKQLAERYGFDYRRHAFWVAWALLFCAAFGVISGVVNVADRGDFGSLLALIVAGAIALEQLLRLSALRRGPAGSFLAVFARMFVRDLLR